MKDLTIEHICDFIFPNHWFLKECKEWHWKRVKASQWPYVVDLTSENNWAIRQFRIKDFNYTPLCCS